MTKEEALDILKEFHDKSALFSVRTALEVFFPEFKESEDERIRKDLISLLNSSINGKKVFSINDTTRKQMIAWIEKQSKHKFNIGDTISNGDIEYRVVDIVKNCVNNDCYSLRRAEKIVEPLIWDCEEADELLKNCKIKNYGRLQEEIRGCFGKSK